MGLLSERSIDIVAERRRKRRVKKQDQEHLRREREETRRGWMEIFTDASEIRIHLARLEERIAGHGKLIAALAAAIGTIAGALAVLAELHFSSG